MTAGERACKPRNQTCWQKDVESKYSDFLKMWQQKTRNACLLLAGTFDKMSQSPESQTVNLVCGDDVLHCILHAFWNEF